MTNAKSHYLAGDRKVEADGSIRFVAVYRNLLLILGMLVGAVCSVALVVSQHPGWLGGTGLGLPFVLLANRRRVIVFDRIHRRVEVTDSSSAKPRTTRFEDLSELGMVQERPGRRSLLVVGGEALCELQSSYANRELKAELAAMVAPTSP